MWRLREVRILEPYDARRGTLVRVREGHWKTEFPGMLGTVQKVWGQSEHAAVDVLMVNRRLGTLLTLHQRGGVSCLEGF